MKKLRAAAKRILEALHDDHEDCYFCDAAEEESHDRDCPAFELEAALKIKPATVYGANSQANTSAWAAVELLISAYDNGAANGLSMDWDDVDQAWKQAQHALTLRKRGL